TNRPPATAIDTAGNPSAKIAPASTGPISAPVLSIIDATTLAAASSVGVRTSHGSVAACSGRYAPSSPELVAARATTARGDPSTAAVTAARTRRTALSQVEPRSNTSLRTRAPTPGIASATLPPARVSNSPDT